MAGIPEEIIELNNEILASSKQLAQKQALLDAALEAELAIRAENGVTVTLEDCGVTRNYRRFSFRNAGGISGQLLVSRTVGVPESLVLVKEEK